MQKMPSDVQEFLKAIKPDIDIAQSERSIERYLDFLKVSGSFVGREHAIVLLAIAIFANDENKAVLTDEQVARALPLSQAILDKNRIFPRRRVSHR